jgi:glycosyltransferase involved in cell wall biosynthesis
VRRSVSILCHTLSGNAFGRAWLLAQLLETDFDVHIIAACRPRDELWLPARGQCSFEIRRWTSFSTPGFVARAAGLARELVTGELIYAVKPRLSSFGLGLVARRVLGRPLVADVDDHELGFSSLARELAGLPWALASAASPGGTWVPHARDEQVFVARHAERAGPPTVMFVGTPRGHKGLDDLLEAFRQVPAPARLRLVGGALDAALVERVAAMREPRVSVEPPVPMRELPAVLEQADVVAIPQKDGAASQGQLPAKLLDAMALGKAIVATRVGDLPQWLGGEAGRVVPPGDPAALGAALRELLSDAALRSALGARARSRFLALGSFAAVRPRLLGVVERVLAGHSRETGLAPFAALS